MPLADYRRRFQQDWANLTVLRWPNRDEGPMLLLANDVSHIASGMQWSNLGLSSEHARVTILDAMPQTVTLTGLDLTLEDVEAVARGARTVALGRRRARERMAGQPGGGRGAGRRRARPSTASRPASAPWPQRIVPPADARRLQENLLVSHAVGVGPAHDRDDRPRDAAAARQRARPRPQRLPAGDRRAAARLPAPRHPSASCPSRAPSARRATSRRWPTWRCR